MIGPARWPDSDRDGRAHDYYAAPERSSAWGRAPTVAAPDARIVAGPSRRRRGSYGRRTRLVLGTLLVALAAAGWWFTNGPASVGGSTGVSTTGFARLLGQQARLELPTPVTAAECESVLGRFAARLGKGGDAAFLQGCTEGGGTGSAGKK